MFNKEVLTRLLEVNKRIENAKKLVQLYRRADQQYHCQEERFVRNQLKKQLDHGKES